MLFLFSRYLNFCLEFLFVQKKQLDKKDVNFKIYDVTAWLTIHILPNILSSKVNKTMKYFSQKVMQKMRQGDYFQTPFVFQKALYEIKSSGLQARFSIFGYPLTWFTIKTNCMKLQTFDPEICSIFVFQKSVWGQFVHHILCIIFREKCFSCYILLPFKISLYDCLYFLRYLPINYMSIAIIS